MLHFVTVVLTFLEERVHSWMYHGIYLGQKISVFDKDVKRKKRGGESPFSCINHVYEKNQQLSTVTVKYFNQNPGKFSGHYSQFLLHHCIPFTTFVLSVIFLYDGFLQCSYQDPFSAESLEWSNVPSPAILAFHFLPLKSPLCPHSPSALSKVCHKQRRLLHVVWWTVFRPNRTITLDWVLKGNRTEGPSWVLSIGMDFLFVKELMFESQGKCDHKCCLFVLSSLYQWCHKQGQHIWQTWSQLSQLFFIGKEWTSMATARSSNLKQKSFSFTAFILTEPNKADW